MSVQRGDVVLAWFPFSAGTGGKRRPCLIVQNDLDNGRLTNTVVRRPWHRHAFAGDDVENRFLFESGASNRMNVTSTHHA